MEDLVSVCLDYVYNNMNQVLTLTPSFTCVSDSLIIRYRPIEQL